VGGDGRNGREKSRLGGGKDNGPFPKHGTNHRPVPPSDPGCPGERLHLSDRGGSARPRGPGDPRSSGNGAFMRF
jgi:hypothetical protein